MSASGTSCFSLMVKAWLWQRIAPTRTHSESIGVAGVPKPAPRPRILLVSAPPFHSSRLVPSPRSASIHGIRLPPSGTPKFATSSSPSARWRATTLRSISRIAEAGSCSRSRTSVFSVPYCVSNSRMCCAPPPEAAW